ncbi:MAG: zinc/manganese transport system permease protein [Actinomycetota bacterium]|nr:zinc/manganese transport system permease protein [Actinomycetota bacterium]MDQ1573191.1 zinc/manganese transport system permease protein [Actinomycetota bacterium]
MFASFMTNTWIAGSIIAVIAGVVGFFVVLRGASFLAHAIPHGAFAGAAGAVLIGADPLLGLGVFAAAGALTVSFLGRRARADVVTALALVMMLGLGALFLSMSSQYSSEVFALLFGQVLGVSSLEIVPMVILGAVCLIAVAVFYRPMLLSSVLPEMAAARGINVQAVTVLFSLIVALATTTSVPVVGALLMFSLLVGPSAAARSFTSRPPTAIILSVCFALAIVWASIAAAYASDLPVGFFVTAGSGILYAIGRVWVVLLSSRSRRTGRSTTPSALPVQ